MTPYWQSDDGRHVVYCGDCLEVLPTLGQVDAVVTDPPYGMGRFLTDTPSFLDVAGPALRIAYAKIGPLLGNMFVFMSTAEVVNLANAIQQPLKRLLWMYKPADMTYPLGGWLLKSEAILWFTKGKKLFLHNISPYHHDVYIHTQVGREGVDGHPTVKPITVIQDIIARCGGESVLDPFAGSGTTAVACVRLGRRSISIELDERYCAIAVKRITDELRQPPLFPLDAPCVSQPRLFPQESVCLRQNA